MLNLKMALRAVETRFVDHRPFILSHLITARCNADCQTCLWKAPADSRADELTTGEITQLYASAGKAGFGALVLWGGEPLIRKDTGEVLRAARAAGLKTTLITNGWWLEARADEILPSVDRLMVSVDGIGERHDAIRRLPGLFDRLDRGLRYVRLRHPKVHVLMNVVLSRLNADQLHALAEYGRQHANSVSFQAMNISEYSAVDRPIDLATTQLSPEEEAKAAREIADLRRRGFPVSDSGSYLARLGPNAGNYRCHFKKVCLRVEPNGDVLDCTKHAVALANVRRTSIPALFKSGGFADFVARAEGCNRCRDVGVVEISHMWEGRPEAIWNSLRTLV
jgi:MoaA/NifB/PqqE/SkfB family radical SAM enzyme